METSDIDAPAPDTAPHQRKRGATPRPWEPASEWRDTNEHDESHLVRGYD